MRYEGGYIGTRPAWNGFNRPGLWTPQYTYQRQRSGLWLGTKDPYIDNVVLFLKGDGTNGSTNIVDSSITSKAINVFGNAQISTTDSKYGGSSLYFDGTEDYLSLASSSDWAFGTGDFTIEGWFNVPSLRLDVRHYRRIILSQYAGASAGWSLMLRGSSTSVMDSILFQYGDTLQIQPTTANKLGSWFHLALSRFGTTLKVFIDGAEVGSVTNSTNMTSTQTLWVGYFSTSLIYWSGLGYYDSVRITKGVGRYTANFNPETDTYLGG